MSTLVTGPVSAGSHGWPFGSPAVDVRDYGYIEQEYFVEGAATRYSPRNGPDLPFDGHWEVEPAGVAPYKTRVVVYRPSDPSAFNGTVIVHWNNVSAGYDVFLDNIALFEDGFAFACASVQRAGVHGISATPVGLLDWDPERYGTLSIPSDDYSFDIFTQIASLVAADRNHEGIDPMGGLDVRNLLATGGSQSAGRLATYLNAIQPLTRRFDGFLLTIYFGSGTPLAVGDRVVNIMEPGAPTRILGGGNLLRDDLGVPVMVVNSELEAIAGVGARQPDTDTYRLWEVAGAAHVSLQLTRQRAPRVARDLGAGMSLDDRINAVPLGPVNDAAHHHLHRWMNGGPPPPSQLRLDFAGDPPQVVRDDDGIASGGVRLPQVEVPTAAHSSAPLGDDMIGFLLGSSIALPPARLRELHQDRDAYIDKFEKAARAAEEAAVILRRDADVLIEQARAAGLERPPGIEAPPT